MKSRISVSEVIYFQVSYGLKNLGRYKAYVVANTAKMLKGVKQNRCRASEKL